jgi:hypothetical protein
MLTVDRTRPELCELRSNVSASLSSYELRRVAFAPVGTMFEHLSRFH